MRSLVDPFAAPFMARALAELGLLALICGPVSVFVFVRRLSFVSDALPHCCSQHARVAATRPPSRSPSPRIPRKKAGTDG